MADLRATLAHAEWVHWIAFQALYDLPDGFLVAGQLGALVSRVAGGTGNPHDFAPYFAPPPGRGGSNLRAAFDLLRARARHPKREPE